MIALLAQSTEPVSHTAVGATVIILMMISKWLWDYNRSKREEAASYEPRATPALHHQFVTRHEFERHVEDINTRLDKIEEAGEQRVIRIYDKMDKQTERIIEIIRTSRTQ